MKEGPTRHGRPRLEWIGKSEPMATTSEWNEIREGLRAHEPQEFRRAAVRVGKVKAENLPDDIAETVMGLFSPDPDMRAGARPRRTPSLQLIQSMTVGGHWRRYPAR